MLYLGVLTLNGFETNVRETHDAVNHVQQKPPKGLKALHWLLFFQIFLDFEARFYVSNADLSRPQPTCI